MHANFHKFQTSKSCFINQKIESKLQIFVGVSTKIFKSNSAPRCKQRGMFAPVISYLNSNKFICL